MQAFLGGVDGFLTAAKAMGFQLSLIEIRNDKLQCFPLIVVGDNLTVFSQFMEHIVMFGIGGQLVDDRLVIVLADRNVIDQRQKCIAGEHQQQLKEYRKDIFLFTGIPCIVIE